MAIPCTPKEGYAVRAGILDTNLLRLIGKLIFHANRIYVGGASMGGDIAVGLVEQFPYAFAGALPACGAVAGWYDQIGYEADFRMVYDYFTKPYGPPLALPGAGDFLTPNPQLTTHRCGDLCDHPLYPGAEHSRVCEHHRSDRQCHRRQSRSEVVCQHADSHPRAGGLSGNNRR